MPFFVNFVVFACTQRLRVAPRVQGVVKDFGPRLYGNKKATESIFRGFVGAYILFDLLKVNRIPPQPRQYAAMLHSK